MDTALVRWIADIAKGSLLGWRSRQRPNFRQAHRLLAAFNQHGIPPQQLPRLMPESLRLTPQEVGSLSMLADRLRMEHLDWASETLALRRDWFDLETEDPHQAVHAYKSPRHLYEWLAERGQESPRGFRAIHVLTEGVFHDISDARGRFAMIYEEQFGQLDDKVLSRYWHLSNGAHFEHEPCVVDLLCTMTIAEYFGSLNVGHVLPTATLAKLESGTHGLVPKLIDGRKRWQLQHWVPVRYDLANCTDAAHKHYWSRTQAELVAADLAQVLRFDGSPM